MKIFRQRKALFSWVTILLPVPSDHSSPNLGEVPLGGGVCEERKGQEGEYPSRPSRHSRKGRISSQGLLGVRIKIGCTPQGAPESLNRHLSPQSPKKHTQHAYNNIKSCWSRSCRTMPVLQPAPSVCYIPLRRNNSRNLWSCNYWRKEWH